MSNGLRELLRLHDDVDRRADALAERHRSRLHCARGCSDCCVDGLTVFAVEAERIRVRNAALLRDASPHPPGRCAFLDDAGACRIYADRPYVCRTQGLPLRWVEEDERGELRERRDICALNADGGPLDALADDACWTLGEAELALGALQGRLDGERRGRVALRALFDAGTRP